MLEKITILPKCYEEMPFPPGYFSEDPGYRDPNAPSYNIWAMIEYADTQNKYVKELSAKEVLSFETNKDGTFKIENDINEPWRRTS